MMTKATRFSYGFILVLLVLVGWQGMATPLITALFAYFGLDRLAMVTPKKWLAVTLFSVLVVAVFYAFAHFGKEAIVALPRIADDSIPKVIAFAEKQGLTLPMYDRKSLQKEALEGLKEHWEYLGKSAKFATKEFALLIIGLVVAASMFVSPQIDLERSPLRLKNNLYSLVCDQVGNRFRNLYHSFAMVMGAQITISSINTVLTSIFVLSVQLPYAGVVIGVTFLCGLLPIIGNIISNAVIVGIGFTISPTLALAALVFLVVLHKLEYFLNSKIIGDRIKNPVWLTLLGLIVGERLMGIPGMILAPVVLHYIKMEAGQIEVTRGTEELVPVIKNGPGGIDRQFDAKL